MTDSIHFSENGPIAEIELARPAFRNAMRQEDYGALAQALDRANQSESIKVCVLSGQGSEFCAGNDVSEFAGDQYWDPDAFSDPERAPSAAIARALTEFRKPLIASVQGRAVGFGATVLLHCDFVIASDDAVILFPFVELGVVPEAGATWIIAQQLGRARARSLLLDPKPISAQAAYDLGLVSSVVKRDHLKETTKTLAARLSSKPTAAMMQTKRLINQTGDTLEQRMQEELKTLADRLNSSDVKAAFGNLARKLEKVEE